jgi:hypothetical protein
MATAGLRHLLLAVGLGCLLAFAGAPAASANPPVFEAVFTDAGEAVLADCGDFLVLDRYTLQYRVTRYFDAQGTEVGVIEHVDGTDTLVNSVTGAAYTSTFHSAAIIDPQAHRAAFTGVTYRLTIPGAGAVLLDVGRVVVDREGNVYFQAGPHQFYGGGDFAGLCAALA